MGTGPGKTSGWVHRLTLERAGVHMLGGVEYERVDDAGLHIVHEGTPRVLDVDHVIVCAGQEPLRDAYLADGEGRPKLKNRHLIGGADVAAELDAMRAIRQGAELGATF